MGHLELSGFRAPRGHVMEDGMGTHYLRSSGGHFRSLHTRSDNGRIFYLGNPYRCSGTMNDPRGFTIFDTDIDFEQIDNPYKLFYNIYYEDTPYQMFDTSEYVGKIVKLSLGKRT